MIKTKQALHSNRKIKFSKSQIEKNLFAVLLNKLNIIKKLCKTVKLKYIQINNDIIFYNPTKEKRILQCNKVKEILTRNFSNNKSNQYIKIVFNKNLSLKIKASCDFKSFKNIYMFIKLLTITKSIETTYKQKVNLRIKKEIELICNELFDIAELNNTKFNFKTLDINIFFNKELFSSIFFYIAFLSILNSKQNKDITVISYIENNFYTIEFEVFNNTPPNYDLVNEILKISDGKKLIFNIINNTNNKTTFKIVLKN